MPLKYICSHTQVNTVCLLFFFFFFLAPVYSQILNASKNPVPVGSNTMLYIKDSVTTGAWIFNNSMIVMIYPGNAIISNNWTDRVTLNLTANHTSLTINALRLDDSGEYTLQTFQGISNVFSVQLSVQGESLSFHVMS